MITLLFVGEVARAKAVAAIDIMVTLTAALTAIVRTS
jgi:hypothetical protein